ncbi:hypothetical protein PGIGA_G00197780 [Pangasianodon gigas]|uniref:Uncharacterized protein n=1 Tax=Pangasianodon gigas TaxID=30993 RepID=A0ACC5WD46_PANGG|nr:hypothetical protein [Pangasianodon gigas]
MEKATPGVVEADHIPPKDSVNKLREFLKNNPAQKFLFEEKHKELYKLVMSMENDKLGKQLICMNALHWDHQRALTSGNSTESQASRHLLTETLKSGDMEKVLKQSLILAHPECSDKVRRSLGRGAIRPATLLPLHHLGQHGPQPSVRCVRLQNEREREVRRIQQWSTTKCSFYLSESLLARLHPLDRIWCPIFSKIIQRAGDIRIVRHKPTIIASQPQELFGLGSRAGRNHCCLINLGTHLPMTQVEAQIPYFHPSNRTLLWVRRESCSSQRSQNSPQVLHVWLPSITIDNNVVQISSGISSLRTEDSVHESLEPSGGPGQLKR